MYKYCVCMGGSIYVYINMFIKMSFYIADLLMEKRKKPRKKVCSETSSKIICVKSYYCYYYQTFD